MAVNRPLEISLKNMLDYFIVQNNEYRFVTKDFGMVSSFMRMTSELFHPPTLQAEGRQNCLCRERTSYTQSDSIYC